MALEIAGDIFVKAIARAVSEMLDEKANCQQRLLDIDQAAGYLGISPGALQKKAGNDVPVVKIDSRLRFDKRDLDRFIDQAEREGKL